MARPNDEASYAPSLGAKSARKMSIKTLFSRKSKRQTDRPERPATMGSLLSKPADGPVLRDAMPNGHEVGRETVSTPVKKKKKSLIMNAFVEMCSGHQSPGLWRHREDESHRFNEVKYWMDLARMLEAGKFHGMFIADVLGGYDVYGGPKNLEPAIRSAAQWPVNEPLSVVPAMAAVTENLGFGVTVSTTYEEPYHLARRLSTVDHLTNGRLAWNVVTGYLDSAARNLGRGSEQPSHDQRYAVCEEYMHVVYSLWQSSWRSDAVVRNRAKAVYTHPQRVRQIDHVGQNFTVPGPHICQPSPQRTPVIFQAGTSSSGKAFAARHAEAVFVSGHSPPACAKSIKDIREQAVKEGRDPYSIKILAKICPIIGETHEEAEQKYQEYLSYGDEEGALALFGGWTGVDMAQYGEDEELRNVESNAIRSYIEGLMKTSPKTGKWTKKTLAEHIIVGGLGATRVGTPAEVADEFERWVDEADVDGFNIAYALMPGTFKDVIDMLLPELRQRGMFWDDYAVPGGTYRENLTLKKGQNTPENDHPASNYLWAAGESKDKLEQRLQTLPYYSLSEKQQPKTAEPQARELKSQQAKAETPLSTPGLAQSIGFSLGPRWQGIAPQQQPQTIHNQHNSYFPDVQPHRNFSTPQTQPIRSQQASPFRNVQSPRTTSRDSDPSQGRGAGTSNNRASDPTVDWDTWGSAASMSSQFHPTDPSYRHSSQNTDRDPYRRQNDTHYSNGDQGGGSFSLGPYWSRKEFTESSQTFDNYPSTIATTTVDGNDYEDDYYGVPGAFSYSGTPGAWPGRDEPRAAYTQSHHDLGRSPTGANPTQRPRRLSNGDIDELKERVARAGLHAVLEEDGYIDPTAVQIS